MDSAFTSNVVLWRAFLPSRPAVHEIGRRQPYRKTVVAQLPDPHSTSSPKALALHADHGDVQSVNNEKQYLRASRGSDFSVFMFYSLDCRSCRNMMYHFKNFAEENLDKRFYIVNVQDNAKLSHGLGVDSLPCFHFYALKGGQAGTLENFATTSPRELQRRLKRYEVDAFNMQDFSFS